MMFTTQLCEVQVGCVSKVVVQYHDQGRAGQVCQTVQLFALISLPLMLLFRIDDASSNQSYLDREQLSSLQNSPISGSLHLKALPKAKGT